MLVSIYDQKCNKKTQRKESDLFFRHNWKNWYHFVVRESYLSRMDTGFLDSDTDVWECKVVSSEYFNDRSSNN